MSAEDLHDEHEHVERDKPHRSEHVAVPEGLAFGTAAVEDPAQALASGIGNKNFQQLVQRMSNGEGILPGGAIHPDVTAAIGAMSNRGGQPLPSDLAQTLSPTLGDVSDARIHTGPEAAALSRAVDARAFTVGRDVFFGEGEFNPGSSQGLELAAHELAHVVQQRGAPNTGSLQVSTPGDALEREADAASRAAISHA